MSANKLSAAFLNRHCQSQWSGIHVFDTLDSTSNWVREQSESKVVCLAEQQTSGRGRHGHQWQSPNAENIYLSFSWSFGSPPPYLSVLSLWVGVVLAEVLAKQGIESHGIKWPNDLYWKQQKMGGILIEASNLSSKFVVGIGLNVNMLQDMQLDQPWVSLSEAAGKPIDRNHLLVVMLDALHEAMLMFPMLDINEFLYRWKPWDLVCGHQVSFLDQGTSMTGEAIGISSEGYLKVRLASGEVKSFGTSISKVRWQ